MIVYLYWNVAMGECYTYNSLNCFWKSRLPLGELLVTNQNVK